MTVQTTIELTEEQAAFAESLVARGAYKDLSAVIQAGLEDMRRAAAVAAPDDAALKALLAERAQGPFVAAEQWVKEREAVFASMLDGDERV